MFLTMGKARRVTLKIMFQTNLLQKRSILEKYPENKLFQKTNQSTFSKKHINLRMPIHVWTTPGLVLVHQVEEVDKSTLSWASAGAKAMVQVV